MKKKSALNRRQFLNLGSKFLISLPVACAIGCVSKKTPILNPKDSLKKLILLLGPWPNSEKQKAEDFVRRFLKAKHAVEPYLPESGQLVQSLASRFSAETMAIGEINLQNLPVEERELLIKLTQQLYTFVEVRFDAINEPPWGHCQGNVKWHTRTPMASINRTF